MSVDDEHNKLYFKQLLSYFLVEQFLLCASDAKTLRSSSWVFVKDLEAFEQINWAKAVFDHLCESLKDLKEKMRKPGQHCFKGAAPALIYERIPSMRPPVKFSDPPIQKYSAQRSVVLNLDKLTAEQ
ncbi:hypothetical protein A2U01_0031466, partial [Trifolium medium]|nr:hypothetical protein [Trifolium medium]